VETTCRSRLRSRISSLVRRLNATVAVNVSYARLLRELLPMPRDPQQPVQPLLQWLGESGAP
jgi:hypothetical protein